MEFVWICKGFPIPSAIFDSQRAQDYVWNCLDLFIVVMGAMDQWVWILMRCKTSGTQYFERICKGKKGDATGIQIYDIHIYIIALLQHMALSLWQGAQGTPRNPRVNHNFPGLIIIFPFQTNSHQIPIHILAGLSSEKSLENFEHPMI